MDISVIIPAYNEERRISATLEKVHSYLEYRGLSFEIIVVDDGSKDNTKKVVEEFNREHPEVKLIRYETNRGKGYAVKTGVLSAQGKLILFSDADLSTPIEELEKLEQALAQGYDVAIGSRGLPDSAILVHQPKRREIAGKIFNLLVRVILRIKFYDTQCGFKLFKGEVARPVFKKQKIFGFVFDAESIWWAQKLGYQVQEVPVVWQDSGRSSISMLATPPRVTRELWQLFLLILRGVE